jgi:hypothetical protein
MKNVIDLNFGQAFGALGPNSVELFTQMIEP